MTAGHTLVVYLANPRHSSGGWDWSVLVKGKGYHFGDCAGWELQFCSRFRDFVAEVSHGYRLAKCWSNAGAGDFADLSALSNQLLARGQWNL
jgi:hypothetical protein